MITLYSGDKHKDWHDCLRLGIGKYGFTLEEGFDFQLLKIL